MVPQEKKLNDDLLNYRIQSWIWATDLHLDIVDEDNWGAFVQQLARIDNSGLIISGDIAESHDLMNQLRRIGNETGRPVLFVLGNHDYYGSEIVTVRHNVSQFCDSEPNFYYLSSRGPLLLSPVAAVVGHDGWADGKIGDYWSSPIKLNDFVRINDFLPLDSKQRLEKLNELGESAAASIEEDLAILPESVVDIIVVTHIPPFREACWYMGKTTDDLWAPFFTCDSVGRVLESYAMQNPKKRMWVLCGHTHHGGLAKIRPNLQVLTGGVECGRPNICSVFAVDRIADLFQAGDGVSPA